MYPILHFQEHHGARVTSPYGMRTCPFCRGKGCDHCGGDGKVMHWGVDLGGVPRGHLWTSPYPGIVTHLGTHGGRGKVAVTRIEDTRVLQLFQHLDQFRCRVGDAVEPGHPIGTNGSTGSATGPHLHYELRWDDGTPLGGPVWGDPAEFTPERARRESDMKEYTVKKGDTLTRIANAHGIGSWQQLAEWNKDRYPSLLQSPGLIEVGWVLRLQAPEAGPAPEVSKADHDALAGRVKSLEDTLSAIKKALYQG